ncbi:hypothetical protein EJB05_46035, partial [Eragrostis curvula]
MLLRTHFFHHVAQVNSHPLPPLMAPPLAFVATLLLLLLAGAAAQIGDPVPLPPPPQPQLVLPSTNVSDAAALHDVFRRWGLEGDASPAENPCQKRVWFESFGKNASIDCNCSNDWCRVTHLNVTGYRNITEIPLALFNLTELISLDLSNNNLSGSIPQEVASLTKLEIWWMFDNYIGGPVPEFIQNLANLTDLRIYGMELQGPIPTNFSKLANLEYLMLGDLGGNHSSFGFIANWANLSTLSLRKCGLTGQLANAPQNLQKLKYLDVSYNPSVNGTLPNNPAGQKWPINYIGTSIDASRTIDSEYLAILNCRNRKECNRNNLTNFVFISGIWHILCNFLVFTHHLLMHADSTTSLAINCGGKQMKTSDPSPTVFFEDSTDLGGAGFHVNNASHWVVSHVGSDPFSYSPGPPGIVNTRQDISGTNIPQLYQTARTSTNALWYYVIGLANRKYTVQLFFAEIVIVDGPGRRLFNIDLQGQNIKKDFDISQEAGGPRKPTNITHEVIVDDSILAIHLYWGGRGTCCIPYRGAYGPLVSAIKGNSFSLPKTRRSLPHNHEHQIRQDMDEKRRGVVAGIAALCIAAAVISSSVVYLWWKWVSLVKRPMA